MVKRTHTTTVVRRAIQSSDESIRQLARRYGINPKTVAKWRQRGSVADLKTGPKEAQSSVLSRGEEALVLAFRRHVVLPLDDSLQALRILLPQLTRSSLHRCWQRHDVSRTPRPETTVALRTQDAPVLGHFSIAATQIGRSQLLVAVELSSKFVVAQLYERSTSKIVYEFLRTLIGSLPFRIHSVRMPAAAMFRSASLDDMCRAHGIDRQIASDSEPWDSDQSLRIGAVIQRASAEYVKDSIGHALPKTREKLYTAITHYNNRCALKALNGFTPHAYILRLRQSAAPLAGRSTQSRDKDSVRDAPQDKKPRTRSPATTREAILEAARNRLAHDGPEGLSLAEVARIAGVNRGTAYQHFKSREKLIAASAEWVSDKLYLAVFGHPSQVADRPIEQVDVAELTDRLANFAMDNPELCRAWLLQVLSSPNPSSDRFWREYEGSTARFAATGLAQHNVDPEVLSVIILAGAFLWPIWARAHSRRKEDMRPLAYRFAQECLRISMYGNLRSEQYPEIAKRLRDFDFRKAALHAGRGTGVSRAAADRS